MKLYDELSEMIFDFCNNWNVQYPVKEEYTEALSEYCDVLQEKLESEVFDDYSFQVDKQSIVVCLRAPAASFMSDDAFVHVMSNAIGFAVEPLPLEDTLRIILTLPPTWEYH